MVLRLPFPDRIGCPTYLLTFETFCLPRSLGVNKNDIEDRHSMIRTVSLSED